ncbi:C-type natriuretic peptide 1 [Apteryx mantelli]|uniref:C-type natriuretic peptide 1 n=2 Tax=Apteryx TaxID=8821 RepID=A0A8B9PQF1_APTOW|nr:PREDICTED: C-type natriuretic peptide [Apteryx mantelli mantelli]
MNLKLLFCPGFLLLLVVSQKQARARPISSLQSLSKLLDEDLEHPLVSEVMDHEQDDMIPTGAFDQQESEFQWIRNTRDQPEGMSTSDNAVQRFFSDLMGLPRRYRGRSKKGLSRGCFGVKLDRIGSLSGLGC